MSGLRIADGSRGQLRTLLQLRDVERDLGTGNPARDGIVFRAEMNGVEIEERQLDDMHLRTEYRKGWQI